MVKLQELLGIDLPIIQAPMAGVQGSALAAAVCNASGSGDFSPLWSGQHLAGYKEVAAARLTHEPAVCL